MAKATTPKQAPASKTAAKPATQAPAYSVGTGHEILAYLADTSVTNADKIKHLEAKAGEPYLTLVKELLDHARYITNGQPILDDAAFVKRMYSLYVTLVTMLETADNVERIAKMELANLIIGEYNSYGEAFSPHIMLHGDYLWSWGIESLHSFQFIAVIMSKLANPATRATELRSVNLGAVAFRDAAGLTEQALNNFVTYYTA